MNEVQSSHDSLNRIQHPAIVVGGVALGLSVIGGFFDSRQFFHSYLMAFLFWLGLSLGCAAILMLHHMVGGGWGFVLRRFLESGIRTLPLMLLFVIPLLFALSDLYSWATPGITAASEYVAAKRLYLNKQSFILRTLFYFTVWLTYAYFLNRWSIAEDQTGAPAILRRLRVLSGPGLVVYGLTGTFAAIDWVMSLVPEWYSTAYGLQFIVGQVLTAFAFAILSVVILADREPFLSVLTPQRMLDLGNLILTFVMLWAYIAFTQFLIIWSGNLPAEISWYRVHIQHGWMGVAFVIFLFHFAVPFLLLLFRSVKRRRETLGAIALLLLVMRLVDTFWVVEATAHTHFQVHWMDLLLPIGMGGIWINLFVRLLKGNTLLPKHHQTLTKSGVGA